MIPRRLLAVSLFLVGLYIYTLGILAAAPALVMTWVWGRGMLWPNAATSDVGWEAAAVSAAVSLYFLATCLSGLCGIVAAGGLWWDRSHRMVRLLAVAGTLGSLGQSLPSLIATGAALWAQVFTGSALIGTLITVTPSVLFAVVTLGTLVVLGGPQIAEEASYAE